jgi:hypothetical protein
VPLRGPRRAALPRFVDSFARAVARPLMPSFFSDVRWHRFKSIFVVSQIRIYRKKNPTSGKIGRKWGTRALCRRVNGAWRCGLVRRYLFPAIPTLRENVRIGSGRTVERSLDKKLIRFSESA